MAEALPRRLLKLEGLALFAAGIALYIDADFSIVALIVLFLVPDLSVLGYLVNKRVGAVAYNSVHTEALPIALGAVGLIADSDVAIQLALIWLAHIGIDRLLGYGLKYPTDFGDTHLQRV